jgi:glutathione synthase
MKVGFFVSDLGTEHPNYATTRLAREARKMGHEVWYISASDFAYDPDELVYARARAVSDAEFRNGDTFLTALREEAEVSRITVDSLDVLLLRNDPMEDAARPWAQHIGITFGAVAAERGVIVLNDPSGLSLAMNKLYFQQFPENVRPKTLVSRVADDIKRFVKKQGGSAVLKPLQGSGGQNVFQVEPDSGANLNQMIEAVTRDGYAVVQEYLPDAARGDTRLFVMNGHPLERDGKYAAVFRRRAKDDIRSNMHVGGKAEKAKITDEALQLAEMIRPKLVRDGMFLVGLDIVGDKLMEINVFSPGGLHSACELTGVNFAADIVHALERKVEHARLYNKHLANTVLATL